MLTLLQVKLHILKDKRNKNPCFLVLGLREGSALLVDGDKAKLIGHTKARLFRKNQEPEEFEVDSDLSFLLQN